jgi:hypothetical protein
MATLDLTKREEGLLAAALEAYADGRHIRDGFSTVELAALSDKVHAPPAPPARPLYRVGTVTWRGDNWTPLLRPPMTHEAAEAFVREMLDKARARGITVYYDLRPA